MNSNGSITCPNCDADAQLAADGHTTVCDVCHTVMQ